MLFSGNPPSHQWICLCGCGQRRSEAASQTPAAGIGSLSLGAASAAEDPDWLPSWNASPAGRALLIKGGCVLTLDAAIGDFPQADLLVRDGRIVQIAPSIEADAHVVDARGMIVMPGFVDTHKHCWQSMLRRFAPNATVREYGRDINRLARHMQAQDVFIGTLSGALVGLDSGVTTMLDWSHISNTPEHSDAAVEALAASGMRAVYGYGQSRSGFAASAYPQDIGRIQQKYFASRDQLLTLALGANIDRVENWQLAREIGVRITCHVWPLWVMPKPESSAPPSDFDPSRIVKGLVQRGLAGDDVTYIHCTGLDPEAWRILADSGATVSIASPSIAQFGVGAGIPPLQQALDHGLRPSLSTDTEVSLNADFFGLMRSTLQFQRALANERIVAGDEAAPRLLGARDMLEFACVEGARANGLLDRVGTLSPGKFADILLLRADDLNTMPLNSAVGTAVLGADRGNVDTVFVQGRIRKWRGRLLGVDRAALNTALARSRDRLMAAAGMPLDLFGEGYGI